MNLKEDLPIIIRIHVQEYIHCYSYLSAVPSQAIIVLCIHDNAALMDNT